MARKNSNAALAKTDETTPPTLTLAPAMEMPTDALAEILGDDVGAITATGTEAMGEDDIRLPRLLLNSNKVDIESGREAPKDVFWNTVTETTTEKLHLQILSVRREREWAERNEANNGKDIKCRSFDDVHGVTEDGTERLCGRTGAADECPDHKWTTDANGKRGRRCTDVRKVFARDRETQTPVTLKVQKHAIKDWRLYYQNEFHMKRPVGQKMDDLPYFAVETEVTPKRQTNANGDVWYTPQFENMGYLPKREILLGLNIVETKLDGLAERDHASPDLDSVDPDVIDATSSPVDSADFTDNADGDESGARF